MRLSRVVWPDDSLERKGLLDFCFRQHRLSGVTAPHQLTRSWDSGPGKSWKLYG